MDDTERSELLRIALEAVRAHPAETDEDALGRCVVELAWNRYGWGSRAHLETRTVKREVRMAVCRAYAALRHSTILSA